jgi:hypothetical protein
MDIRSSLHVPQVILRALKLMIMQVFSSFKVYETQSIDFYGANSGPE